MSPKGTFITFLTEPYQGINRIEDVRPQISRLRYPLVLAFSTHFFDPHRRGVVRRGRIPCLSQTSARREYDSDKVPGRSSHRTHLDSPRNFHCSPARSPASVACDSGKRCGSQRSVPFGNQSLLRGLWTWPDVRSFNLDSVRSGNPNPFQNQHAAAQVLALRDARYRN
jgi:hypothetical protein